MPSCKTTRQRMNSHKKNSCMVLIFSCNFPYTNEVIGVDEVGRERRSDT
jgi:hypothetical protein